MLARIFRPARTAMQSGKAAALNWVLEYEPERRPAADPLMGYTSTTDMRRQIRLEFATREEAVQYATRSGIPFTVIEENTPAPKKISYSDNFRTGRPEPWTH
ncbi:MAG TPA: ETC complex I subunit [Bauldia sp.]|nr:ETC complex I subunit [Bauldia sp.]